MAQQPIKKMTVKEFRELGYLQELNRRFLHPLGIALEVNVSPDGHELFSNEVWDYRDDPEGLHFAPGVIDAEKAQRISAEETTKKAVRMEKLGYKTQPV